MVIRLPWRVGETPNAVPVVLGLVFLASAVLKLDRGGSMCFDPWAPANTAMIPLEFALAYLLWSEERREFGALLATATLLGAASLLTWAHWSGRDVRSCGCFGAIEMSYGSHMTLIGILFTLSLLTLLSAEPATSSDGGSPRPARCRSPRSPSP